MTASIVAWARGAAGVDPIAARLVPFGTAAVRVGARGWLQRTLLVDHMRVRTVAIDRAVKDAAERGTRQVVVLGAGLCARGWRLDTLADSVVFEVDHPATQHYKRARLEGLRPVARSVRFVSVDFEKDDLAARLEEAGHDASKATTWIWEGVTPYLTPHAIAHTLRLIRARSTVASTLLLTYVSPEEQPVVFYWIGARIVRAIGEPLEGVLSVEAMHRVVEANGFTVAEDSAYAELARRMDLPKPRHVIAERLLVATAV